MSQKLSAGVLNSSTAVAAVEGGQQRQGGQALVEEAGANCTGAMRNRDVPSWNGPEQATGSSAANGDPFTTKLNGKAVSFAPSSPSGHAGQISQLNAASEALPGRLIVSSTGHSFSAKRSNQPPVGTITSTLVSARPPVTFSTAAGPHVTVPGGHYMKLEDFPSSEVDGILNTLSEAEPYAWKKKVRSMVCPPNAGMSYLTVWLSFDDMRDASNAMEDVGRLCPASRLSYISHNEFVFGSRANGPRGIQSETSFYDGQLVLKATFFEHGKEFSARGLYEEVVALCKRIGEIVGVAERIVDANIRHYHVEFYKISDAKYMVAQSDDQAPTDINGWLITVTEIPDVHPENTPQRLATLGTPQKLLYENGNTAQVSSPTGRTNWTFNQYGMPIPTPAIKQLPKITSITAGISMTPAGRRIRGSDPVPVTPASCVPDVAYMQRSGSWPSTDKPPKTVPYTRRRMPEFHPNVINVERIEQGIDVRTTIMVRNIPNEMTADQLKEVVDRACRGRYDFIYLRFDFAQNKNVGYAFVNFLAPSDVLTFFYAYNGKEYIEGMGYHPVRGPRLGEIAYATCQGQDCAIEKFRNSSIMCEYPGYRPRLFWTIEDAPMESLVSQERQFPGINNHSKHNRSKDNAAQIGLYAPKSRNGAVITRNSQFDRGTPAQMQEDAMFQHHQMYQQPFAQQQMVQQPFGYGYNDGSYALGNQHMSMPMGMGMPVGSYPVMYNAGQQYVPYQTAMNGSPHAYAPSAPAFHGSPGPIMPPTFTGSPGPMHHNGFNPSRLRTITGGRLGNPVRRRMTVRPPRDLETAIREVEEGRREQEEYDAMKAIMEVEEEAAATQSAGTPRFMNGEENNGGTQGQYGSVNGHAMGRFDSRQGNGEKHH